MCTSINRQHSKTLLRFYPRFQLTKEFDYQRIKGILGKRTKNQSWSLCWIASINQPLRLIFAQPSNLPTIFSSYQTLGLKKVNCKLYFIHQTFLSKNVTTNTFVFVAFQYIWLFCILKERSLSEVPFRTPSMLFVAPIPKKAPTSAQWRPSLSRSSAQSWWSGGEVERWRSREVEK